jgi:hypothetical protein
LPPKNCPAPEARKKVAHGDTVGLVIAEVEAPAGAAEKPESIFELE